MNLRPNRMNFLRDLPIKRKLTLISLLTCSAALLLACGTFVAYERITFRRAMVEELATTAQVIGFNSASALSFNDTSSAEQTLKSVAVQPHIIAACVYDRDGRVFATFEPRNDRELVWPAVSPDGGVFGPGKLELFRKIELSGELIGTVFLRSDLEEMHARLKRYGIITGAVFLVAILISWLIVSGLQRIISDPISHLADIAARVGSEKNYALRAVKSGNDELGALIGGFNDMLAHIETRESDLQAARSHLEERVKERTAELAHSLSLLNATLDATTDGILAVDLTGKVIGHNSRFVAMSHLPPGMVERGDSEAMMLYMAARVRDGAGFIQRSTAAFARPEQASVDVIEFKDGRTLERYVHPQRMNGTCVGVVISFRDITERRQAQDAAAQEQERLKFIFESVSVGINLRRVRPDGVQTRLINDAHLRICGLTREEVDAPHAFQRVSHPGDYAHQRPLVRQLAERKIDRFSLEKRYLHADGRVTWVTFSIQRRNFPDGSYEELSTVVDITALKEAETKLAYERDQLRSLLESSPDTIYFKDRESRFVRVSLSKVRKTLARLPELKARLGRAGAAEADLLNGLTDFDTYHEEDARSAYDDEQQIILSGQPITDKLEKQRFLDGSVRWSLTNKMPWLDREGNIIGTFGSSKDVSELKDAEGKLDRMNRQLLDVSRQAGMAEVATGVLHNVGNVLNSVNVSATLVMDQLRDSKMVNLPKLGAMLHEHAADLHRFLTSDPRGRRIPDYLASLSAELTVERKMMVEELAQLRKNIEHIKDIVAMQQSYARVSGVTETIAASELADDALRINSTGLARHGLEVVRDYRTHPVLTTERHKVMQVLVNLIRNAKHACDDSGRPDKRITVQVTGENGVVCFTVIDNGVGIPPENLTRIFSHGFTTRKEGHGFGLHSGALVAKELGGALTVQSDGPGLGAAFTLELPCRKGGAA